VVVLSVDPQEVYWFMEAAYRYGVLEKFMSIQGMALDIVMAETGADLGDILNRLDEIGEDTVLAIDKNLQKLAPLAKYFNNDRVMHLANRLLSSKSVENGFARWIAESIKRALANEPPPSIAEKLKCGCRAIFGKPSLKKAEKAT